MDFDERRLGGAAAIALLVAMIVVNAESHSEAACISAIGIGGMIFVSGLFVMPFLAIILILAYPFSKSSRKELHSMGWPFALIFGFIPVVCGVVVYLTGGC